MKKVFEGGLSKVRGIKPKFEMDYRLAEWLELNLPWDRPVRIAVEELPESKPEPDKNCGNCAHNTKYPNPNCEGTSCKETGYSLWQPKPAEPQGWEQRVCSNCNYKSACAADKIHLTCTTIDAIRAEIAEAEKRGYLRAGEEIARKHKEWIEQNKHREGGKMKRTTTMWAVIDKDGDILIASFAYIRIWAHDHAENITGVCWKGLYSQGYRCRKVTISWEE